MLNLLLCFCTASDFSGLLYVLHNDGGTGVVDMVHMYYTMMAVLVLLIWFVCTTQ